MGAERQTKRSCLFCQSEDRDSLESQVIAGEITARELDKEFGWRSNTAQRHINNHMGEYVKSANPSCPICIDDSRREFELQYFEDGRTCEEIAKEIGCSEDAAYRHMKHHFQPIVKQSASALVAVKVGHEVEILRNNVETLNGKLGLLMNEVSIHDDGAVSDLVKLHKEVRETLKDLVKYQEKWSEPEEKMVANTINILKVEMAKESPDTWKRVKQALLDNDSDSIEIAEIMGE